MPTLSFTAGNDVYTVTAAGTYDLSFLAGDDTLTVNGGTFTTAHMGIGNDLVYLRAGAASIFGDAGNDLFAIYAGGFTVDGGDGADRFNVRGGNGLRLTGGLGDDRVDFLANAADFISHGNDGNDRFYGNAHVISGSIYGDAGNDYFEGFANRAGNLVVLYGGLGNDIYRADPLGTTIIELTNQGTDTVRVSLGQSFALPDNVENLTVVNYSESTNYPATLVGNALNNTITAGNFTVSETLVGGAGNDRLTANGAADSLYGGDGNDVLTGNGSDSLYGEAGNDLLRGNGFEKMFGGPGNDTYNFDLYFLDTVVENANEGIDTIRIINLPFNTLWTLPANFENVQLIYGDANFTLFGNELNNKITGSSGADTLYGWGGNDNIAGWGGDDFISGGFGSDRLTGGTGNDTFFYRFTGESPVGNVGVLADVITDFGGIPGPGGDILDLSFIDAANGIPGDQAFHYSGMSGVGDPGDLWILNEADGHTHLYGDVNGDFMQDFEIVFDGPINLDDIVW